MWGWRVASEEYRTVRGQQRQATSLFSSILFCQERVLHPDLNSKAGSGQPPLKQIFLFQEKETKKRK